MVLFVVELNRPFPSSAHLVLPYICLVDDRELLNFNVETYVNSEIKVIVLKIGLT